MRTMCIAALFLCLAVPAISAQIKSGYLDNAREAMDRQDYDRAIADISKAIEINPADPEVWLTRAAIYLTLGRWGEAVQDMCRVNELNSQKGRELGQRLGRAALGQGDGAAKAPPVPTSDPVTRIVKMREVQVSALASILTSLSRSWQEQGRTINVSWDNLNNVLVTGDAKPVAAIVAELAQLDQAPVDFTLRFYLMRAADQPPTANAVGNEGAEKDIAPVVEYLKQVVRYKQFSLIHTGLLRMQEHTPGSLTLGDAKNGFELHFNAASANREAATLRLGDVSLHQTVTTKNGQTGEEVGSERTILRTSVQLKDGEVAVLGASRVDGENEALVLVVRCDFVK